MIDSTHLLELKRLKRESSMKVFSALQNRASFVLAKDVKNVVKMLVQHHQPMPAVSSEENQSKLYECNNCSMVHEDRKRFKKCAKCKTARYCSRSCQKEHWSVHEAHCCTQPQPTLPSDDTNIKEIEVCTLSQSDQHPSDAEIQLWETADNNFNYRVRIILICLTIFNFLCAILIIKDVFPRDFYVYTDEHACYFWV